MADSASSTNAPEADIREDRDELADGRSGRSAFLSDIKPSDRRCVTRVGRLCDLTGKLSLSTEEFRLVSMLILPIISIERQNACAWSRPIDGFKTAIAGPRRAARPQRPPTGGLRLRPAHWLQRAGRRERQLSGESKSGAGFSV